MRADVVLVRRLGRNNRPEDGSAHEARHIMFADETDSTAEFTRTSGRTA